MRPARPRRLDGVAQAFAEAGQVPDAAVVAAVVVAGRAADVARRARGACRARRRRAACPAAPAASSFSLADRGQRREQRHVRDAPSSSSGDEVVDADRAVHEVVDVEALAVGREREALRRAADVDAEQLEAARARRPPRPRGWSRARRTGRRRARSNATALATPALSWSMRRGVVLAAGGEVDARADRAHGVLEVERLAVAQRAALDVVLLRRHPGRAAVRRDRRRRRGSSGCRGPGSRSPACRCAAARSCAATLIAGAFDDDDLAAHRLPAGGVCTVAVLSPGSGGVMKRDTYSAGAVAAQRRRGARSGRRRADRASHAARPRRA